MSYKILVSIIKNDNENIDSDALREALITYPYGAEILISGIDDIISFSANDSKYIFSNESKKFEDIKYVLSVENDNISVPLVLEMIRANMTPLVVEDYISETLKIYFYNLGNKAEITNILGVTSEAKHVDFVTFEDDEEDLQWELECDELARDRKNMVVFN